MRGRRGYGVGGGTLAGGGEAEVGGAPPPRGECAWGGGRGHHGVREGVGGGRGEPRLHPSESRIRGWSGCWAELGCCSLDPRPHGPGRAGRAPPSPAVLSRQLGRLAQQVCGACLASLAPPPLCPGLAGRQRGWRDQALSWVGPCSPRTRRESAFMDGRPEPGLWSQPAGWACARLKRHLPLGRFADDASALCSVLHALVRDDRVALPTCLACLLGDSGPVEGDPHVMPCAWPGWAQGPPRGMDSTSECRWPGEQSARVPGRGHSLTATPRGRPGCLQGARQVPDLAGQRHPRDLAASPAAGPSRGLALPERIVQPRPGSESAASLCWVPPPHV